MHGSLRTSSEDELTQKQLVVEAEGPDLLELNRIAIFHIKQMYEKTSSLQCLMSWNVVGDYRTQDLVTGRLLRETCLR